MDPFYQELGKLGLAGVFIAYLMKQNWDLRKDSIALLARIDALQDKRVGEVTESVRALGAAAAAGEKMAEALEGISESVQKQTVSFEQLAENACRFDPDAPRRSHR